MRVEPLAISVGHLDFVDATQVNPAVAVLGHAHFEFQIEVLEFTVSAQVSIRDVRPAFVLDRIIDENPVLYAPTADLIGIGEPPAVQVLFVEQGDGFAVSDPGQVRRGRHRRNAFAGEFLLVHSVAVRVRLEDGQLQLVAVRRGGDKVGEPLRPEDFAGGVFALHVAGASHVERIIEDEHAVHRLDAARDPQDTPVVVALLRRDAEPAGAAAGNGQRPSADKPVVGISGSGGSGQRSQRECAWKGTRELKKAFGGNHLLFLIVAVFSSRKIWQQNLAEVQFGRATLSLGKWEQPIDRNVFTATADGSFDLSRFPITPQGH